MTDAADIAACRALLRHGSRSFHAASRLLPASMRAPASALYAFCRLADDAVDLGRSPDAVARLRARLDRVYAGAGLATPSERAFAAAVARGELPRALPEALLEGFAWDAEGRRYEDLPALRAYAVRVAGTVGAMMAVLMGVRDAAALARACDLGVAMQLTNIARDVGEDARAGRLYLPLAWLRAAGIDPDAFLAAPAHSPALAGVVARLLAEADALYRRAEAGIAALPRGCRPAIWAARRLYAAIGAEVARAGGDAVGARAVVPGRRKLALLARVPADCVFGAVARAAPPLPEAAFLVDAAALPSRPPVPAGIEGRIAWLVELFTRLELEDAAAAA